MKASIKHTAVFLLLGLAVSAGGIVLWMRAGNAGMPLRRVPPIEAVSSVDMGDLLSPQITPFALLLRNTGTMPVHVVKVYPSCGCTSVVNSQETIPPNGVSRLSLLYDSTGKSGRTETGRGRIQHTQGDLHSDERNPPMARYCRHGPRPCWSS